MTISKPARLSMMMFLQYGGLGAWAVPLARWLGTAGERGGLAFAPSEIAWIYSTTAFGALIAPLFVGILADRTFSNEKLIGTLNAFMAVIMFACGKFCSEHAGANADASAAFGPLFTMMFFYSVAVMIGLTSGSAMTLRTLEHPTKQFGRVRLIGTLGWIVAVAIIGLFLNPLSEEPFLVGAVCHGLLAVGSRWLPHTPPLGRGKPIAEVVGLPALKLFRDPSFIVFVMVAFVAQAMQTFYSVFGNVCCAELGMSRPELYMTSSQWVEMVAMALIPLSLAVLGLKFTLLLGLIGWAVRCAVFSGGSLLWIAWVAVPLQGLAYTYFTIVGALYIDREAPPHLRAGAQALMTFISGGPANLFGNYLAGQVVAANRHNGVVDWHAVWMVPTIGVSVACVLFLMFFREPRRKTKTSQDLVVETHISQIHAEHVDDPAVKDEK